ncbi:uncharacterized protein LOC144992259 [Oryzias latipes]
MTEQLPFDLFILSLVLLLIGLTVVILLCCVLRSIRNRFLGNFTELQITSGKPTRQLTIRAKPEHAPQLLDQLLDRVLLQHENTPGSGEEAIEELGQQDSDATVQNQTDNLPPQQVEAEACPHGSSYVTSSRRKEKHP